jgi:hypothetical protein
LQELKPNDLNSLPFSDGSRVGTWYAEQVTSGYAVQSRMASAAAVATGATTASVTVAAPIRKEAKGFLSCQTLQSSPTVNRNQGTDTARSNGPQESATGNFAH